MLQTGLELGHFRLKNLIGRSANDVYLAEDMRLPGREVAIKLTQSDIASFPTSGKLNDEANQFKQEAKFVSNLHHAHILPLFEYGEEIHGDCVYTFLVMPYKKDGTLERWIKQQTKHFRNLLPLSDVSNIIGMAADALQCAHDQGIIHRDVKLSNFLIDNKTSHLNYPHILLSDFGIAKFTGTDLTTRAIGTFAYMAPEQWEGHPTKASDQYSLAVIAYQLLTGVQPFTGNPGELYRKHTQEQPHAPSTINPALPPAIDAVILRAMSKEPTERYSTIHTFATELQAALADDTTTKPVKGTIILGDFDVVTPPEKPPGIEPVPDIEPVPSPSFSTKVKRLLLTVLVLLLIGVAAIPIYSAWADHVRSTNSGYATATANVHNAATATHIAQSQATANAKIRATSTIQAQNTAIAQATANANAQATASVVAQVSATAGVLQTATSGQPVYQDALNNSNNSATRAAGWNSSNFCKFQADGYHVLATSSILQPCMELKQQYQNVTITVDMVVQSSFSSAGLLFHVQRNNRNAAYFFEISPNQQEYKLSILNCNCQLVGWTPSASIHSGNSQNILQVIANGNDFKFYINGAFLTDITDTHYHYSNGGIGFVCYDHSNLGEALFSNLTVYPSS